MVSYMCQSQWSSPMFASAAPMPPCAATVCERVGNTFESTATRRPACASSREARMPEPPAPTITASNLRTGIVISSPPQDRERPEEVEHQHHGDHDLRAEPERVAVQVVDDDVAHPDPRVPRDRDEREQRREAEEAAREE